MSLNNFSHMEDEISFIAENSTNAPETHNSNKNLLQQTIDDENCTHTSNAANLNST